MTRRTVQKISPSQLSSFDQQFWPVLVAITVLSGIAFGAVLTILRGPWMWGSLILLPLLALAAVFLLFRLDDRKLRRSFQFAILISLAAHLLVMMFASVTNIFQNPFEVPERQIAQQKVRTIEISDQRASFVWEKTNSRETPEPDVQPEKDVLPTTDIKPQPVPVKTETPPQVSPQLVRRETPQSTVPKQNPDLSQLRRQTRQAQPLSSQQASLTPTESNASRSPDRTPQPPVEPSENRSQAESVQRAAAEATAQLRESSEPSAPAVENTMESVAPAATRRRAEAAESPVEPTPSPSSATARVRRTTPRLPVTSEAAPTNNSTGSVAAASATESPTPSESAADLTRRPTVAENVRPVSLPSAEPSLSPSNQFAAATERRSSPTIQPSISNAASEANQPRRSTADATIATSPTRLERPARTPESQNAATELNSKALSISRSTAGAAGIGRSANLERFTGGEPSPAQRASDSARRERTLSALDDSRMLTSSRQSQSQRSKGTAQLPSSTLLADTSAPAKLSGSREPAATTADSSAAQISAASTNHRDETSAERGTAAIDLGPTKIANEARSERRSGGGQTEVARLSPDMTRRSREQSNAQPALAADAGPQLAAPRSLSTSPPAAMNVSPAAEANLETRSGADAPKTFQLAAATIGGDLTNRGTAELNRQLSEGRRRSTDGRESATLSSEDEPVDANDASGDSRSRIAQAPVTRLDPGFGIEKTPGRSNTESRMRGPGELAANDVELVQRATTDNPGSGLQRGHADEGTGISGAATPVRSSASRRAVAAAAGLGEVATPDPPAAGNSPGRRATPLRPQPSTAATGLTQTATGKTGPVVTDDAAMDSAAVDVQRAEDNGQDTIAGMALDIDAVEGPAGLGDRPDESIGVLARPASRESEQIMPDLNTRFRNREFGGMPAMNPDAVLAQEAFRNRSPATFSRISEPTTEASIQLGLEFLARHQLPDGSWSLTGFDQEAPQKMTQLDSDSAATGLALLAFQGAGYNHREYKYASQMDLAIRWLIEHQSDNGSLYVASDEKSNSACRLYSHGIATLALTEAYGMTRDPSLREPAQKALDYIVHSQDPRKGGWRYSDQPGKQSADTSVSGWMMMAIQSGQLAELEIDPAVLDGIDDWLDVAADPNDEAKFRYNPYLVDAQGVSRLPGRQPSVAMTSVGLLMRVYRGWKKDDPRLLAGADHMLATQLPSDSTPVVRDTYYWYYATQVFRHIGGARWEQWNDTLRPLLTRSQEKTGELAGSWHPYRPVPDRWGPFGGRLYVTTMNLLSLEVRHRLLPLYQQQEPPLKVMGIIERGDAYVFNTGPAAIRDLPANAVAHSATAADQPPALAENRNSKLPSSDFLPPLPPPGLPVAIDGNRAPVVGEMASHSAVKSPSTPTLEERHFGSPAKANELGLPLPALATVSAWKGGEDRTAIPLPEEHPDLATDRRSVNGPSRRLLQRHLKPSLTMVNEGRTPTGSMNFFPPGTRDRSEIRFDPQRDSVTESALANLQPDRDGTLADFDSTRVQVWENPRQQTSAAADWTPRRASLPDLDRQPDHSLEPRVPRTGPSSSTLASRLAVESERIAGVSPAKQPANPRTAPEGRDEPDFDSARDAVGESMLADLMERVDDGVDLDDATVGQPAIQFEAAFQNEGALPDRRLDSTESAKDLPVEAIPMRPKRPLDAQIALENSLHGSEPAGDPSTNSGAGLALRGTRTTIKSERTAIQFDPVRDAIPASTSADRLPPRLAATDLKPPSSMNLRSEGPLVRILDNVPLVNRLRPTNGRLPILPLPVVATQDPVAPSARGRLLSGVAAVRRLVQNRPPLLPMNRRIQYGAISGTVYLDGKALPQARVEFIPLDAQETRIAAATNQAGQFLISQANAPNGKGLQAGRYRVAITTYHESPSENVIDLLERVPDKYNAHSSLEITIEADKTNRKDWKLSTQ